MVNVTVRKVAKLGGEVEAPSSKSFTQRMVIASALSKGRSIISNPLYSEDTEAALRAVKALGAKFKPGDGCWQITGPEHLIAPKEPIDCGESGATLRFMIPVTALADGLSILTFRGSIERRPVEPLLKSLRDLGAKAQVGIFRGWDAVFVEGGGLVGGKTTIPGDISSQFISGLMFACPLTSTGTEITITSTLESADYIKMTEAVLSTHAVAVGLQGDRIIVEGNQIYKPTDGCVPGDFSSATFLLAAAAITKSNVNVNNLDYETVQGDKAILTILKQMGVNGTVCRDSVRIEGNGTPLKPIEVDAKNFPDLVPAITVLACYAEGNSKITGAKRLRLKESDRLLSISEELSKMGAKITVNEDGLTVTGTQLHGATLDSHNDHRIAMAAAVAALGAKGETTIEHAESIRKSYPQFFTHLKQIGADLVGGKFDR